MESRDWKVESGVSNSRIVGRSEILRVGIVFLLFTFYVLLSSPVVSAEKMWNFNNHTFNISNDLYVGGTIYGDGSSLTGIASNWNVSGTNLYPANLNYNVGIGTSSPQGKLSIYDSVNRNVTFLGGTYGHTAEFIDRAAYTTSTPNIYIQDADNNDARASLQIKGNNGAVESLFVASSGKVGIGTITPHQKLEVNGVVAVGAYSGNVVPTKGLYVEDATSSQITLYTTGSSVFGIYNTGAETNIGCGSSQDREINFINSGVGGLKVGIGTTSPTEKLDVRGEALIDLYGQGNASGLYFRNGFTSGSYNLGLLVYDDGDTSADALDIAAYDGIYFNTGSNTRNPRMVLTQGGELGIGTTSPGAKTEIFDSTGTTVKD